MNRESASSFNPLGNPVIICLLLALATIAIYLPVTHYGFVDYDDADYFFGNPHVLNGFSWVDIKWAFTSGQDANWHPLTWLSLMLDAQLFGNGAAAPHLINVLLHAANAVLVFLLFRRLTGAYWRSATVALLFAIHPLHVESVVWVSERKDVLSGFFGLLTLLCYARYAESRKLLRIEPLNRWLAGHLPKQEDRPAASPSPAPGHSQATAGGGEGRSLPTVASAKAGEVRVDSSFITHHSSLFYWLALLLFACGLMSKPMLVTLPFVMLLLDFWPLQGSCRAVLSRRSLAKAEAQARSAGQVNPRLIIEKIPFFLLSAAASVVTFFVQQRGGAVSALTRISMLLRVENAFASYARYLGKIFWPVNLAVLYPYPGHWLWLSVIGSIALFAALCVGAVVLMKKFPFVFTGWFWFAGMLVPVIGIVQVGSQAMADRYAYLPLIGILILVVWGLGELCARLRPPRELLIAFAAILFLACAVRARNQASDWENDETLFGHALVVTKNNYVASLDLGYWYSKNGQIPDALHYYYEALRMSPGSATALYDIGNAFAKLGRWDEAIRDYRRALQITPDQPDIMDNLGFALAQTKQLAQATACFQAVLKLKPDSVGAHNNLATIYFMQKRYQEAAQQFNAAAQLAPDNPRIIVNLGDALVRLGQTNNAIQCYQRALQLQPDDPAIRAKLQSLGP